MNAICMRTDMRPVVAGLTLALWVGKCELVPLDNICSIFVIYSASSQPALTGLQGHAAQPEHRQAELNVPFTLRLDVKRSSSKQRMLAALDFQVQSPG